MILDFIVFTILGLLLAGFIGAFLGAILAGVIAIRREVSALQAPKPPRTPIFDRIMERLYPDG